MIEGYWLSILPVLQALDQMKSLGDFALIYIFAQAKDLANMQKTNSPPM